MEKSEKKQPYKRTSGKINFESVFGFIALLLFVLLIIKNIGTSENIDIFDTIGGFLVGLGVILGILSRSLYKRGATACHYCHERAWAIQKLIHITWYKYSNGETPMAVCLHTKCHEKAKQENRAYKVPDPDFETFEI